MASENAFKYSELFAQQLVILLLLRLLIYNEQLIYL